MARSLTQIMAQVEELVEKRASTLAYNPPKMESVEDLFKLASAAPDVTAEDDFEFSESEKFAAAILHWEVISSKDGLLKIAHIEQRCKETNQPDEVTQAFIEKVAGNNCRRVFDFFDGVGRTGQGIIDAVSPSSRSVSRNIGHIAAGAIPAAALIGGGAYAGSKLKERQIKKQLGYTA
jgi:hypothetical protein